MRWNPKLKEQAPHPDKMMRRAPVTKKESEDESDGADSSERDQPLQRD
jgi:hypothetical protein